MQLFFVWLTIRRITYFYYIFLGNCEQADREECVHPKNQGISKTINHWENNICGGQDILDFEGLIIVFGYLMQY